VSLVVPVLLERLLRLSAIGVSEASPAAPPAPTAPAAVPPVVAPRVVLVVLSVVVLVVPVPAPIVEPVELSRVVAVPRSASDERTWVSTPGAPPTGGVAHGSVAGFFCRLR